MRKKRKKSNVSFGLTTCAWARCPRRDEKVIMRKPDQKYHSAACRIGAFRDRGGKA